MIFKDYYKILGLTTNRVTAEEIKKAYKEQAKKYHPDLNGGNRKYEERFKDINESYKVLSDSISKRKYDRIWYNNVGKKNKVGRKAPNSNKEAIVGMFFGNAFGEETKKVANPKTKGENITTEINISVEDAFFGLNKTLGLKNNSGKVKTLDINIPAGIQNKGSIRLVGQGKPSSSGGNNGDLLVKVNIKDTEKFKLRGDNLEAELLLTPWEAGLGQKINYETLDGEVTLYISEGTQSGEKIVLPKKGYPNSIGIRGDLILETKIVLPKNLNDEQKQYLDKMKQIMNYNPRK